MHARSSSKSGQQPREAFPRARRVRARRDFLDVYEHGTNQHGRLVVVFARLRPAGGLRLGITATRKAGGAVARNRARRRTREVFRRWAAAAPDVDVDLVVNISARATQATFAALSEELSALLSRATAAVTR